MPCSVVCSDSIEMLGVQGFMGRRPNPVNYTIQKYLLTVAANIKPGIAKYEKRGVGRMLKEIWERKKK